LSAEEDLPLLVHIRLSGGDYKFANDRWLSAYPDIAIFDSTFVEGNIYSGSLVDHDHKKNLYRVIVGKKGVELNSKIENITNEIRRVASKKKDKEAVVKGYTLNRFGVKEYVQLEQESDIDEKIQKKGEELKIANKSSEIQSKQLLGAIHIPSLPDNFQMTLGKSLEDISADAHESVRSHIFKHEMQDHGESWLSQGLGYIKDFNGELCPFCGQSLDSNELLEAYRIYFSASYANLKQEVGQLAQQIHTKIGEGSLLSTQATISENRHLFDFWAQIISESEMASLPMASFRDIQQKYANLREQCLTLALRKQRDIIEPIQMSPEFSAALKDIEGLQDSVSAYNDAVMQINECIKDRKTAIQNEPDISAIEEDLELLGVWKQRFDDPEVAQTCDEYQAILNEEARLNKEKMGARNELSEYDKNIFLEYRESMNAHLEKLGAGFRIERAWSSDKGKTRSFEYCIEINNTSVSLTGPPAAPSFENTLSTGDKSTLALAFFLAKQQRDKDIHRKIVVFDDPFTSLDQFRITWTEQSILNLSAEQIIVLSHEKNFLKLLWDGYTLHNEGCSDQDRKALQIAGTSNNASICKWDIEHETQTNYVRDYSKLQAFAGDGIGELLDIARAIRPVLEELLKHLFPSYCRGNQRMELGKMIGRIQKSDVGHDFFGSKEKFDQFMKELKDINEYSRKYTHANPGPIYESELRSFVKRTLKLVGGA